MVFFFFMAHLRNSPPARRLFVRFVTLVLVVIIIFNKIEIKFYLFDNNNNNNITLHFDEVEKNIQIVLNCKIKWQTSNTFEEWSGQQRQQQCNVRLNHLNIISLIIISFWCDIFWDFIFVIINIIDCKLFSTFPIIDM